MIASGRPVWEMIDDRRLQAQDSAWRKFLIRGRNPALATVADIIASATGAVDLMTYRTVGVQIGIASASANDTLAGTGAQKVMLTMLTDAGVEVTETLSMNGQTKVQSTATNIIAINQMEVVQVGGLGAADGGIDAGNTADAFTGGSITTAANFMHAIMAGKNLSEFAGYTVPANKHLFIKSFLGTVYDATATVKYATLELCYLPVGGGVWQYFALIQVSSATGTTVYGPAEMKKPLYFPPGSAFRIRGVCSAATAVLTEIEGFLING